MDGFSERDTQSGIHVVRLHYTADSEKRSEEWKIEASRGLSKKSWAKEMEIDWTIASGEGVYDDEFVRELHVSKEDLLWYPHLPVVRGWDLGATHLHPACIWMQADLYGRVNILRELATWNGRGKNVTSPGMSQFAEQVIVYGNTQFPNAEYIDVVDPSAFGRSQTDGRSCADVLRTLEIYPTPGPSTFTARKEIVQVGLRTITGGRARLLVDHSCTMIIEGLAGAYQYKQIGDTGQYTTTALQNAWAHVCSALEYGLSGLTQSGVESDDYSESVENSGRASKYY
jgi:hypothetical protein